MQSLTTSLALVLIVVVVEALGDILDGNKDTNLAQCLQGYAKCALSKDIFYSNGEYYCCHKGDKIAALKPKCLCQKSPDPDKNAAAKVIKCTEDWPDCKKSDTNSFTNGKWYCCFGDRQMSMTSKGSKADCKCTLTTKVDAKVNQDTDCLRTEKDCEKASSKTDLNGVSFCCHDDKHMSITSKTNLWQTSTSCKCKSKKGPSKGDVIKPKVKLPVTNCLTGFQKCLPLTTKVLTNGQLKCCPAGNHIASSSSVINYMIQYTCTCTPVGLQDLQTSSTLSGGTGTGTLLKMKSNKIATISPPSSSGSLPSKPLKGSYISSSSSSSSSGAAGAFNTATKIIGRR